MPIVQVFIKVDGADLSTDFMDRLTEVVIESALGYPDTFTISFFDDTVEYIDKSLTTFDIGKAISIAFSTSESTDDVVVFDGEVTAISPEFGEDWSATLVVSGYDKRHRLMNGTYTRAFIEMTDSDIVKSIAGDVGLTPQVDSLSEEREHVFQDNQTNMEFLEELAQRNGFQIYIEDKKLYFKKPDATRTSIDLVWRHELASFRARLSAAQQVTEVTVRGWDTTKQKAIEETIKTSKTAPSIGANATNTRFASKISAGKHIEVRQPVASSKDAKRLAQAIFDEINSEFIEAEGIAIGVPTLIAGVDVKISKIGEKFSGTYHVTNATHYIEKGVYKTEFRVEGTQPNVLGGILNNNSNNGSQSYPLWTGIYPAKVTNNVDPDKINRVKLKYPWFDDSVESGWARVITLGAGKEMGMHWLPEIDDEVLVAFERGNFNYPYVLGGVHSQKLKPSAESQEGEAIDKRVMKSRSGHMIIMDDTSGSENVIIETKGGHKFTLHDGDKKVEIESSGGKKFTIDDNGNKISIEGAQTVEIKSTQAIKIEAGQGVEIKGTASVKVEAPQVDINGSGTVKIAGAMIKIG